MFLIHLSHSKTMIMAKYSKGAGKKVKRAMHEMKKGELKSGRSGKKVTSRKQAIAIGLSEARERGAKVPSKGSKTAGRGGRSKAAKRAAPKKTASKSTGRTSVGRKKSAAKKSSTRKSATKSSGRKSASKSSSGRRSPAKKSSGRPASK
jgi:hypothetical protein